MQVDLDRKDFRRTSVTTEQAQRLVRNFSATPASARGSVLRSSTQIQPKLSIGAVDDRFEREADKMADAVMRMRESGSASRGGALMVQRSAIGAAATSATASTAVASAEHGAPAAFDAGVNALAGRGQPLKPTERSFFEQRMGHDFGDIRLHTDNHADTLAGSVRARAFAYGRNIVFRSGEYDSTSAGGRHLLAHELTHSIQQGAAAPATEREGACSAEVGCAQVGESRVQRLCTELASPPPMTCQVATTSPGSSTTFVTFAKDSAVLTAAAKTTIQSVAAAWHRGGATAILRLDGFASIEGSEERNCPLSCDRANAIAAELNAPSNGDPGVPATSLSILAQGATDQFSTSLEPNRRVVLTTTGGAPAPGPACGLGVIGPDEVDHYCAAYVPSDAAACGTFPAPDITLSASGSSPGTTPSWSIVTGIANASIVGAANGASVRIRGDAASAAQGDVIVQVTDGTCTTTHAITVREPSDLTAAENPSSGPTFVQNLITYTLLDQFGNPLGARICLDETVTICSSSVTIGSVSFGDAPTNASGQATDTLRFGGGGPLPASLCIKLNQSITAGGCGPVAQNTIVYRQGGITLNRNDSCASGDSCP